MDDLSRIRSFIRWFEATVTDRTEPWRFGTAFFDDRFPNKWDANFLRVDRPVGAATPAELAAEADRLQSHLRHREFIVPDDGEGARLAGGLGELGYAGDRLVTMSLRREPDRPAPDLSAGEADLETVRPVLVRGNLEMEDGMSRDDAEMLVDYRSVIIERIGARFFAASVDGEVAGCCELYLHDGVAQIEDVVTAERFRNRGVARAFLDAAIAAAREAGAEVVFLVADDDDWPKHLYAKLGFDEVDRFRQFTKPPPKPVAAS
jgi:N-acetylglutamate synthase-like GNAT family acetyltransferase